MNALPRFLRGPGLPMRSERQSYSKDLTKATKAELMEILERMEKLVKNK